MREVSFLWLEITGRCQLACLHCYASSGPSGTHGVMTTSDWLRVLGEAAGLGVRAVQFIGGEPTLHPGLPTMVDAALGHGLDVEVFTNLVRVTPSLWQLFSQPGVRLATSYYSDDAGEHAAIVGRPRAHRRTRANITEVLARGIPLRVGVIDLDTGQRSAEATAELAALGVTAIGVDHLRQVGRGIRDRAPDIDQLCGRCGRGVAAIGPDGSVWPCVFSRWLALGNLRRETLARVLAGEAAARVGADLTEAFARRGEGRAHQTSQPGRKPCKPSDECGPDCAPSSRPCRPASTPCWPECAPAPCSPQCGPSCAPACTPSCWPTGTGPCTPNGGCVPNYG